VEFIPHPTGKIHKSLGHLASMEFFIGSMELGIGFLKERDPKLS
jgi:hypothetical protein